MATKRDEFIPTRDSLLSRIKDWADRDSWQDFFDSYWKLIYSTARKAGLTDAEAQDIVQETVLSVARNIEGFRYNPAVCSFKTWMLQLTRWRIINQLKKRQRETAGHCSVPSALAPAMGAGQTSKASAPAPAWERIADPAGFDLEAIWDQEWEQNLLAAAMERVKTQVNPEQLQLFDLYCVEQWPARKVAQTLHVSLGQIYLAKHRIGRLLKKEIRAITRAEG